MRLARWVLVCAIVMSVVPARAEPSREFIMSSTYGVLAGTLVGAATLAFTDHPGDNLKNIARGASYGLYAGILLGLYVIYGIPEGGGEGADPEYQEPATPGTSDDPDYNPEDRSSDPQAPIDPSTSKPLLPLVFPLISERGVEGAGLGFRYSF